MSNLPITYICVIWSHAHTRTHTHTRATTRQQPTQDGATRREVPAAAQKRKNTQGSAGSGCRNPAQAKPPELEPEYEYTRGQDECRKFHTVNRRFNYDIYIVACMWRRSCRPACQPAGRNARRTHLKSGKKELEKTSPLSE